MQDPVKSDLDSSEDMNWTEREVKKSVMVDASVNTIPRKEPKARVIRRIKFSKIDFLLVAVALLAFLKCLAH